MVVPYTPMIDLARPYVGQCAQIVSGPYIGNTNVYPDEHYDIGINVTPSKNATWWWVKHLMPIDPPEEVKDEEANDHSKKPEASRKSPTRNRSLQSETT
jgi:hypothetical protein